MIINELTITNFGIYSGIHSFDLTPSNDADKTIVLVGGMNGRGKTTILEAILLALYGKRSIAFRDSGLSYSSYLEKFINKSNPSFVTSVELLFTITINEETIKIKIKRSWSKSKSKITDKLTIWRNSEIDNHLTDNWETYIEELIPSGVSGLFFFDGEKINRLANEDTDNEMKEAIKAMLGIDLIDRVIVDMKRIINKKQFECIEDQNQFKVEDRKNEINQKDKLLQPLKQRESKINADIIRLENTLSEKENEFLRQGGTLNINRSSLLEEKGKLAALVESTKEKLVNIATGPLPLLLVPSLLQKINTSSGEDEKIKAAKYNIEYLSTFIPEFIEELNKLQLVETNKKEILHILEKQQTQANLLQSANIKFNLSPNAKHLLKSLLGTTGNDLVAEALSNITELNKLEASLENVERYLLVDIDEENNSTMLNEIKTITSKITNLSNEREQVMKQILELENDIKKLETEIEKENQKYIESLNAKDDTERIIKYAASTQKIMQEFSKKVLSKKLQNLAVEITNCFNYLTNKESFLSKIEIEPETISLKLYDSNGDIMLRSQLSAGERQMLAISILWGLAKSSSRELPVIIDTPLSRLDSSHRMNFVAQYLPKSGKQVVILSTDEEIRGQYLNVLDKYIYRRYLLKYDNKNKATSIIEGYFEGVAL